MDDIMINYLKNEAGEWTTGKISIEKWNSIKNITKIKKGSDIKYSTFFAFHTGKVNMSSRDYDIMENYYNEFYNIINNCKKDIEEILLI